MTTTGEKLREERERLGFTQTDFGSIGGVSKKTQGNYEGDSRYPDSNYLAAIAEAGADILYIVTGQRMVVATRPGVTTLNEDTPHYEATVKTDRWSQSPLDDIKLLEAVIRVVEKVRPDLQPNDKAKLITLMCELHRVKYGQAPQEEEEDIYIEEENVIRLASVLSR